MTNTIIIVATVLNIYSFTKVSHFQLTAWLAIGSLGAIAVRLAVEPRREDGRSSRNQRTEELRVWIWRKRRRAILTNVKVLLSHTVCSDDIPFNVFGHSLFS